MTKANASLHLFVITIDVTRHNIYWPFIYKAVELATSPTSHTLRIPLPASYLWG